MTRDAMTEKPPSWPPSWPWPPPPTQKRVEETEVDRAADQLSAVLAAPRAPDSPQGCDHKALLQQTAAALWDLQHEPDCWCAYFGGSGPTGHTEACAQARVVNEQLKAAGVQHWPPQEPPR